jgi:hypothetical protein
MYQFYQDKEASVRLRAVDVVVVVAAAAAADGDDDGRHRDQRGTMQPEKQALLKSSTFLQ